MSSYLQYWSAEARRRKTTTPKTIFNPWVAAARPNQLPPEGDWFVWLILAGRGWGKTRTGAEFIRMQAERPQQRGALVGQSSADVRDVMVEGSSGLLSVLPPSLLLHGSVDDSWNRSMLELTLANGTRIKGYSAEKPRQLRGPQHHFAWVDEPASFADANQGLPKDSSEITTISNLLMGMRLGTAPRVVVTGTPQPNRLIRELLANPGAVITRGSTDDNTANLSPVFMAQVVEPLRGTRAGRQELEAEMLEDVQGALWQAAAFGVEGFRCEVPVLQRVVVGVDPNASNTASSDEMGIIVAGVAANQHIYVLADYTTRGSVDVRAAAVVRAFHDHSADGVIVEVNNGGDWIPSTIQRVDPIVRCKTVHATRGKLTRAEPIAQLYEQRKAHHCGNFAALEAELTGWTPGQKSPNRLDALVWAVWELTRRGTWGVA
jgi:phage terminase large subunit-like protein